MSINMEGIDGELLNHIKFLHTEKDNVEYGIIVKKDNVDNLQIIDNGLLLAIIDSYTSYAGLVLLNNYANDISVSMTLTLTSFEEMYVNNEYKMKVFVKYEGKKIISYDYEIYDLNDKIIK